MGQDRENRKSRGPHLMPTTEGDPAVAGFSTQELFEDHRREQRMLARELAVAALIVALLVLRAVWL